MEAATDFKELDDAKVSSEHRKIMFISGMGFFTDAYDLFIIGVVLAILKDLWHVSKLEQSLGDLHRAAGLCRRRAGVRAGGRHARTQTHLRRSRRRATGWRRGRWTGSGAK